MLSSKNKTILVICAHPDDVDFGCSGTLALLSKNNNITYVICTNGEKGNPNNYPSEELIKTREEEQINAANIIGIKEVLFLRKKDGELENTKEFQKELVKIIRKVKPNIIFTHDPSNHNYDNFYLYHPDHRAVAHAVFDAIYPAVGNRLFFPDLLEQGFPPHKIEEIYFFGTITPNTFIDISSTINKKIQALFCHKSQISHRENFEEYIKERAKNLGKENNLDYAEAFRRLEVPD